MGYFKVANQSAQIHLDTWTDVIWMMTNALDDKPGFEGRLIAGPTQPPPFFFKGKATYVLPTYTIASTKEKAFLSHSDVIAFVASVTGDSEEELLKTMVFDEDKAQFNDRKYQQSVWYEIVPNANVGFDLVIRPQNYAVTFELAQSADIEMVKDFWEVDEFSSLEPGRMNRQKGVTSIYVDGEYDLYLMDYNVRPEKKHQDKILLNMPALPHSSMGLTAW